MLRIHYSLFSWQSQDLQNLVFIHLFCVGCEKWRLWSHCFWDPCLSQGSQSNYSPSSHWIHWKTSMADFQLQRWITYFSWRSFCWWIGPACNKGQYHWNSFSPICIQVDALQKVNGPYGADDQTLILSGSDFLEYPVPKFEVEFSI